ncbi:MAG: hypothetical protein ACM3VT_09895, partial [Solirubrobacterales bacterium]
TTLAERIVSLCWRLKRAERLQTAAFDSLLAGEENDPSEKLCEGRDAEGDFALGQTLVRDFSGGRTLDRLLMYERRIENSLYRTMAELKRHRLLQEVEANGIVALRRALGRDEEAGGVSSFKREVSSWESGAVHTRPADLERNDSEPACDVVAADASKEVQESNSPLRISDLALRTSQTKPISRPEVPGVKPLTPGGAALSPTSHFMLSAAPPRARGVIEQLVAGLGLYRRAGLDTIPVFA